jgi:hypothetical protein
MESSKNEDRTLLEASEPYPVRCTKFDEHAITPVKIGYIVFIITIASS